MKKYVVIEHLNPFNQGHFYLILHKIIRVYLRYKNFFYYKNNFIFLSNKSDTNISKNSSNLKNYREFLSENINTIDYKSIHKNIDTIIYSSLNNKIKDKLFHKDISILKLLEIRWFLPIFQELIIHLNYYSNHICKKSKNVEFTIYSSFLNFKVFRQIFNLKKNQIVKFNKLIGFLLSLYDTLKFIKLKLNYFNFASIKKKKKNLNHALFKYSKIKKSIFIICTLNRYIDNIFDTLPLLSKKYNIFLIISKRVEVSGDLKKLNLNLIYVEDFINQKIEKKSEIKNLIDTLNIKFVTQNFDLTDHIKTSLQNCLQNYRLLTIQYINFTYELFNLLKPVLVLSFEQNELSKCFNEVARVKKVKTAGYISFSPDWFSGITRRDYDKFLVSGNILKGLFKPWFDKEIKVVGTPYLDKLKKYKSNFNKSYYLKKYNIEKEKKIIGLISTYMDGNLVFNEDIRILFEETYKYSKKLNMTLIVRPHPLQPKSQVIDWLNKFSINAIIIDRCSLKDFTLLSDLVVVPYTTATWEIMVLGKPTLSFVKISDDLDESNFGYCYKSKNSIQKLSSNYVSTKTLEMLCNQQHSFTKKIIKNNLEHAKEHLGPIDRNSSIRFCNEIIKLINQK